MFYKQFGGKVTKDLQRQYAKSSNWRNGHFQNLEQTVLGANFSDFPRIIYKQLSYRKNGNPKTPLPVLPFDKSAFLSQSDQARFIWYGHSVVLMRMDKKNILIDPMFGSNTTPIAPLPTKRFSNNTLDLIDEFPEIHLIMLTHDHYDHLDYASIQKLKHKTNKYFVSLGVKRHLVHWGISPNKITEFDWWETQNLDSIQITFTPTRHFSGRGLTDRAKTLWGGWVFKTTTENIWFSGDGGYGKHFKEIGNRLGPFDFAFMECGQYNEDWRDIHLFPDGAVQAAIDANVRKAMPVHWGGFSLSYQHMWHEPPTSFIYSALEKKLNFSVPPIGRLFDIDSNFQDKWWLKYI